MTEYDLPPNISPIQLRLVGSKWRTVNQNKIFRVQEESDSKEGQGTIRKRLDDQHDTLTALHPTASTHLDRLEDVLPEGSLLIATDGGVQTKAGFGWVMATPGMEIYAS